MKKGDMVWVTTEWVGVIIGRSEEYVDRYYDVLIKEGIVPYHFDCLERIDDGYSP